MIIVAHRGASDEQLENSSSALHAAINIGVQRVECDLQVTADDNFIVMHDRSLERTVGVSSRVRSLGLEEISKLELLNGDPILNLEEVLTSILPSVEVNLEIKTYSDRSLHQMVQRLSTIGERSSSLYISSFDSYPIDFLSRSLHSVNYANLWGKTWLWPHVSSYLPSAKIRKVSKVQGFYPSLRRLTVGLMEHVRKFELSVIPYLGLAEEKRYHRELWAYAMTMGVDGICTNLPRRFKHWWEENANYYRTSNGLGDRHTKKLRW